MPALVMCQIKEREETVKPIVGVVILPSRGEVHRSKSGDLHETCVALKYAVDWGKWCRPKFKRSPDGYVVVFCTVACALRPDTVSVTGE